VNFVPAIQAGKDVYQEKTGAFSPEHARCMRRAYEGSGRVVQIGMQMQSGPGYMEVRELATPERIGTITLINTDLHMQNWFDCTRSRKEPNCPFEIGYRTAIACQMAVASYGRGEPVGWDPETEHIV